MSVQAITWVLEHSRSRLGARCVLFSLANHAHADGSKAFPSVATVAREACMSERAVQYALRNLEASGEIVRTGATETGTSVYRIPGVQNLRRGVQRTTRSVSKLAPEPSVEPTTSPNGDVSVRKRDKIWDALVEHLGEPVTKSERGRRNKVVKELREAGATPASILGFVETYRREWPNATLRDTAIANNWSTFTHGTTKELSAGERWLREEARLRAEGVIE